MKIAQAFIIFSLAVAGCSSPKDVSSGSGAPNTPVSAEPNRNEPAQAPATEQKPASASLPTVPDDLKTDAYHWYGLSNDKPMKVKVTMTGQGEQDGTQTIRLKSVENGKATYEIERPEVLGTETVSLEKSGIYTIASSKITGAVRNLEMPSSVPPGATWKNTGKIEAAQEMEQNIDIKVLGIGKVTTAVGAQDALHIKQTGTLKLGGTTYRIDSDVWYVKDKGMVKNVATMRDAKKPKDPPKVVTIEESK